MSIMVKGTHILGFNDISHFQMASPALESVCCLFNDTMDEGRTRHLSGMPVGVYNSLCILSGKGINKTIVDFQIFCSRIVHVYKQYASYCHT